MRGFHVDGVGDHAQHKVQHGQIVFIDWLLTEFATGDHQLPEFRAAKQGREIDGAVDHRDSPAFDDLVRQAFHGDESPQEFRVGPVGHHGFDRRHFLLHVRAVGGGGFCPLVQPGFHFLAHQVGVQLCFRR